MSTTATTVEASTIAGIETRIFRRKYASKYVDFDDEIEIENQNLWP